MFPPIDDAVLQNNPKFAALHKTLTTRILNPDGSSKALTTTDRDSTAETLLTLRTRATKASIFRSALTTLPLQRDQKSSLPPALIELIILLTLKLTTSLGTNNHPSLALLHTSNTPYATLQTHLPHISAQLLSPHLHTQALALTRLLHPRTNASFLHRTIPKISSAIHTLLDQISTQRRALSHARAALVPLITRVLEQYRAALASAIRLLESKHGQVARSVTSRAELLSAGAQNEVANAEIVVRGARRALYSPEVESALENYRGSLKDGQARLRERERHARRELVAYGAGREGGAKEKVMREIARVYAEVRREIGDVKVDLERLQGA